MTVTSALTHRHSLDDICGYRVRLTIADGRTLVGSELHTVAYFYQPGMYAQALEVADRYRKPGSWAVVDNMYDCGCTAGDDDYPPGCPEIDLGEGLCPTCEDAGELYPSNDPTVTVPCPECTGR